MSILWITPLYVFDDKITRIAVQDSSKKKLIEMAADIEGTDHTAAIYIPLKTPNVHRAGLKKGQIVGLVRLPHLPKDKTINDFYNIDYDGKKKWPYGWPCEVISYLNADDYISLCSIINKSKESYSFSQYTEQFQYGPAKLSYKIKAQLEKEYPTY